MKDGSEVSTRCNDDGKTTFPVPSTTESVCSENGPSGSLGLHKDCDANKCSSETTNTWGDFESFNEFTPQSDQLSHEDGSFDENIEDGEGFPDPTDEESQWDAFNLGNESRQECERIFRFSFPAIPVEDPSEDVRGLPALLASSTEENLSTLIRTRLWLECEPSRQNPEGCEWPKSKGCRDLMTLLGSTAENSSIDEERTEDALPDNEKLYFNESTPPAGNKYLIQTKLDVAPGSKSGHIFSYQLVLKKSQNEVSLPFLTFIGKKSFFSANQLRFNF
ncbi:uncharacterized protein CLBA1 isoform 1-T2 [Anomaloglossus baeobatrachus]|uniref:uncharacterized protein CLBA1 n=1 Tax=Anomaloglossus baeobatrachus TaxID=238106 RepID=UPI003F5017EC